MKKLTTACYFILTENCNLRCTYCFEKDTRTAVKTMSEEVAFKTVDYLLDNCVQRVEMGEKNAYVHITFFGGEPTLATDLMIKILRYTKNRSLDLGVQVKFSIITNGTIFNEKVEEFLEEWYMLFGTVDIQLSVDGCPEVQNMNRPCANSMIKSSDLVEEVVPKYKAFLEKHNLNRDCIYIHAVVSHQSLPLLFESHMYFITKLQVNYQFAWVVEDQWTDDDVVLLDKELSKIIPHLSECTNNVARFPFKRFDYCSGCGSGRGLLSVDTEGNIYPCHRFFFYSFDIRSDMLLGNIMDENPIDDEKRQMFLDIDEKKICDLPCQVCIAVNYETTGDMYKRPNDFDVKSMVILNHHFKIFSEIMEKKNMNMRLNDLTNKVRSLNNDVEWLKRIIELNGLKKE